jgi:general L-amino acid transport system permease protein
LRYSLFSNAKTRAILIQVAVVGAVVAVLAIMLSTAMYNRSVTGVRTGFGFLHNEAGFAIGETLISYSAASSYGRALVVGTLNTLRVAIIGVILATLLGVVIGILRLSKNFFLKSVTGIYVELFRNLPVLVQLLFWYSLTKFALPAPQASLTPLPNVYLNNRGISLPMLVSDASFWAVAGTFLAGLVVLLVVWRRLVHQNGKLGRRGAWICGGIGALTIIVGILVADPATMQIEFPVKRGFNFQGGLKLSPEFAAMLIGLTIYTSAFIGEIVRAGILSVNKGQVEASVALGLTRLQTLRLVVLPQAFRLMIPPTTSQYLNLTKNSSLAVAIGYPDLVNVGNTVINQTGQSVEIILVFMGVYLSISLIISLFMNWYDRKMALTAAR